MNVPYDRRTVIRRRLRLMAALLEFEDPRIGVVHGVFESLHVLIAFAEGLCKISRSPSGLISHRLQFPALLVPPVQRDREVRDYRGLVRVRLG